MENNDQKRLIIAGVLIFALALLYQVFFAPKPQPVLPSDQAEQQENLGSSSNSLTKTTSQNRETVLGKEASNRISISSNTLDGSFSSSTGVIDDLTLVKYYNTAEEKNAQDPAGHINLLNPVGTKEAYQVTLNWRAQGADKQPLTLDTTQGWKSPSKLLSPSENAILTWENGSVSIKREIALDEQYMMNVTETVTNTSAAPLLIWPSASIEKNFPSEMTDMFISHEGIAGYVGKDLIEVDYKDSLKLQDDKNYAKSWTNATGGWIGFSDKYWLVGLIPDANSSYNAFIGGDTSPNNEETTHFITVNQHSKTIAPGGSATYTTRIYTGTKEFPILNAYKKKGIEKFDRAIDFGWFYSLTRPFLQLLLWLKSLLGDMGFAIVILTVLVKAALFPLAYRSYKSMAKMRKLAPKLQQLREKFSDDRQKMQVATMELYKQEGANPVAGCLPLILQIPVFFALYKVFFVTIEMRQETTKLLGWVHDLSQPDPSSVFNLFGLLSFDVPGREVLGIAAFLSIGILPIIMGITMWGQQKLSSPPTDPTQAKLFLAMPIVFTFILGGFAAGLVFYWSVSNLLSIIQQWTITRMTTTSSERAETRREQMSEKLKKRAAKKDA